MIDRAWVLATLARMRKTARYCNGTPDKPRACCGEPIAFMWIDRHTGYRIEPDHHEHCTLCAQDDCWLLSIPCNEDDPPNMSWAEKIRIERA